MAMNGRHMPPGQGMPPDNGRRRHYSQHPHHQQQPPHYPQAQQSPYNPYMNPYNPPFYPQQQQQYHPQWNAQAMPPQYLPQYPSYEQRTPSMHHYGIPPQHASQQPPPPQQFQCQIHSPAIVSTPYQPPSVVPPAPSSVHSQHSSSQSYPIPETPTTPAIASSVMTASPLQQKPVASRPPFVVPLPWLSHPENEWPERKSRRKRISPQPIEDSVELPNQFTTTPEENSEAVDTADIIAPRPETPTASLPASDENVSTNPTTPSSQQIAPASQGEVTPTATKSIQRPPVSVVPVLPAVPKSASRDTKPREVTAVVDAPTINGSTEQGDGNVVDGEKEEPVPAVEAPKAWTKPKAWAGLFNKPGTVSNASGETDRGDLQSSNQMNAQSLAEALNSFNADSKDFKVSFIEPRGLVNTGNMCYMNSVLQVLVFCAPFYNFLDEVSKKAVHSFKSDTPLIDAMIMFLREFQVIDSAANVDKLRLRLKDNELEQYGSAFTPDFVYEVINRLPRFSTMRRGHQQDAEEFLGFLLEGMHDESIKVIKSNASNIASAIATPTLNGPASPVSDSTSMKGDTWQEVGPKQRAAVSRSVDQDGSPVTKIFGGKLRSEFRVPGLKDSVTYEPYQPLQLDIGAPNVNNIVDALKALTRSETLHGDFRSPKGPNVTAVKQVFIEEVPPVLILHLKRFQYDNTGGTQKIWKKIGYPLELELPKEVFSRKKRNELNVTNAFPQYRLTGVVYHHGKNASGGHYTVDVRRQDGREWIRLDDTVIRRIRTEDVAGAGSEEDPKVLAAALNAHKNDSASANPFAAIDDDESKNSEDEWKQANGPGKKWSNVVNGASTPKPKAEKSSVKDNKVAYLLFYQRI